MLLGLLLVALRSGTTDIDGLAARAARSGGPARRHHGAGGRRGPDRRRPGGKAPMFPLHTWLPAGAHDRADRRLGAARRRAAQDGHLRHGAGRRPRGARRGPDARPRARRVRRRRHPLGRPGLLRRARPQAAGRLLLGRAHGLRAARHRLAAPPQGCRARCSRTSRTGWSPALLFLVAGALKDRAPQRPTSRRSAPACATGCRGSAGCWPSARSPALGLPGLAGFWGELLAIGGAWQLGRAAGRSGRPLAVLAAVGTARRRRLPAARAAPGLARRPARARNRAAAAPASPARR